MASVGGPWRGGTNRLAARVSRARELAPGRAEGVRNRFSPAFRQFLVDQVVATFTGRGRRAPWGVDCQTDAVRGKSGTKLPRLLLVGCVTTIVVAATLAGAGVGVGASSPARAKARLVTIDLPAPGGEIGAKWLNYCGSTKGKRAAAARVQPREAIPPGRLPQRARLQLQLVRRVRADEAVRQSGGDPGHARRRQRLVHGLVEQRPARRSLVGELRVGDRDPDHPRPLPDSPGAPISRPHRHLHGGTRRRVPRWASARLLRVRGHAFWIRGSPVPGDSNAAGDGGLLGRRTEWRQQPRSDLRSPRRFLRERAQPGTPRKEPRAYTRCSRALALASRPRPTPIPAKNRSRRSATSSTP